MVLAAMVEGNVTAGAISFRCPRWPLRWRLFSDTTVPP
jgi:hypothetical protein